MNRPFNSKCILPLLFFLFLMVVSSVPASAQIENYLECKIPFPFTAVGTRLPAGTYTIAVVDISVPSELELHSADDKIGVFLETNNAKANGLPKISELVFDRIGQRDFLREIWVESMSYGYQLSESRAEAKLVKQGQKRETHRLTVKHVKK